MIDPGQLTYDILGNAISVVMPGVLWAVLFLCAFEHGPFAESVGLGRRAFWLLLPGAIAATLADLPFLPISNDVLGISLGGALFPLLVAVLAFTPLAPPARRSATVFLGVYGGVAAVALAIVVRFPDAIPSSIGVLVVAALAPVALFVVGRSRGDGLVERVAGLLAVTDGVLFLTFLFSSANPGVGISEGFPQYLIPPIGAGVVFGLAAPQLWPRQEGLALPAAFLAGTFGVLVGADVLREPPLYPSPSAGLYIIGGAGVLDLVYLSGLLAFLVAFAIHTASGRSWAAVGGTSPDPPPPTPVGSLGRAFRRGIDGDLSGSLTEAAHAARAGALQAGVLLSVPPPPAGRPWQGLPVPGWVVSDFANLEATAAAGSSDGRESYRGWLTARLLVGISVELGSQRLATAGSRTIAFLIDLALVTAPAALLWAVLAVHSTGGLQGTISSVPYNAAIYGYISLAFVYFVVSETVYGTTVGKRLCGLSVRQRQLGAPRLSAILVRNAFRLPVVSVVGVVLGAAVAILVASLTPSSVAVDGFTLPAGIFATVSLLVATALGVGLLGIVGFLTISVTSERQRWGDLAAGTWVVREPIRTSVGPGAVPAPGPGPSG
ncbi:MAG TPA: RDD family protein [Thermoplasmata archaeon]|nr:RDD family protein [Thermoplasmata archaeon]